MIFSSEECMLVVFFKWLILELGARNYFFFNVKKLLFLGSSLRSPAGSVWDLEGPAEPSVSHRFFVFTTHAFISSSSLAWNSSSAPPDSLKTTKQLESKKKRVKTNFY